MICKKCRSIYEVKRTNFKKNYLPSKLECEINVVKFDKESTQEYGEH